MLNYRLCVVTALTNLEYTLVAVIIDMVKFITSNMFSFVFISFYLFMIWKVARVACKRKAADDVGYRISSV